MSTRKKPSNFIQRLFRSIWRFFNAITKAFISWLLRSSLGQQRRRRSNQAGFVLPTVVMVVLVVTLLTTAILFRSFDRSKNASNYRVNEVVLNAAAPALDRSRAKLNRLFSAAETELPGNTPADDDIAKVFEDAEYTFGDETQLKLVADLDGNGIQADEVDERLKTAWKFPVDTDNNGFFDSFTLYGVYFRVPQPNDNRARGFLEARTRPQDTGASNVCLAGNGGAAGDEGSGWYSTSGQLKKAFFTYVANVPITPEQKAELDNNGYKPNIPGTKFEPYKGNRGFSALEMQQDQARLALDNNAVWYEDDLIITDVPPQGGGFKLNGRVQANSNLMLGSGFGDITFYQVSSPWSCFYKAENAKIVVGGNVSANGIAGATNPEDQGNNNVKVHLFKEPRQNYDIPGNTEFVNTGNVTTNSPPRDVAYNTNAYAQRLNVLVIGAMNEYDTAYPNLPPTVARVQGVGFPVEIPEKFQEKYPTQITLRDEEARNLLEQVITVYFKERIRRVPYAEIPIDDPDDETLGGRDATTIFAGGTIKAPEEWMDVSDLNTAPLSLKVNELEQTNPDNVTGEKIENEIGDRILVGNGLPVRWLKDDGTYAEPKEEQPGAGVYADDNSARGRESQAKILDDLGDTSRNGFWEKAAADPSNVPGDEELAGGLRVVTGAGIYIDGLSTGERLTSQDLQNGVVPVNVRSFLPEPPVTPTQLQALNAEIVDPTLVTVVWPDTMPMYQEIDVNGINGIEANEVFKGDLQMRATVVYHYTEGDDPIACISSYYDPTNPTTATNSDIVDTGGIPEGASNNGINYGVPARDVTDALRRQAYMVFPDGRWANKPLKDAIEAFDGGGLAALSLEQKAAIDAANCALAILAAPESVQPGIVPNGAIRERAFLDARQVKTLHKPDVEFDPNGLTFINQITPISRETIRIDGDGKVLIADPEQLKIATQATLNSPVTPKNPTPAEYSLPIEERQPLEIRVTEIDLEQLRTTSTPINNPDGETEYLLPLSGIIYASRDDALSDITDVNLVTGADGGSSATDFKLDPSRRPNGIRLWSSGNNGGRLSRGTINNNLAAEKGLILASNLPVYIKGDFNRHYEFGSNTPVEEFDEELDAGYTRFYNRGESGDPDELNANFACRNGSNPECDPGDQWRAARVLSDAITLLSNNFRDGFREEGNYDFNNNAGNLAVASRLKNGFWWNGYGTNYLYKDTSNNVQPYPINLLGVSNTEFSAQDGLTEGSSYVMNGVTPIQRRVEFPEYKMEICTKLPVSECGLQDWDNGAVAGTTAAATPPTITNRDYPRRVAFERDPDFKQLVLASDHAKPLDGNGTAISYGSPPPAPADNALWFWTTTDNDDPSVGVSYDNENLLYYLPDDLEVGVATERQMLLPGTPKFPEELSGTAAFAGQSLLNGITDDDPSDYLVCIGRGSAKDVYQVDQIAAFNNPRCQGQPRAGIFQMWQALRAVTTDIPDKVTVRPSAQAIVANTIVANAKVNFIDFGNQPITGQLTLDRGDQPDPIFIIRRRATGLMTLDNVVLTLKGVDPNNIFWFSGGSMRIINDTDAKLAGNFIGNPLGGGVIRIVGSEGAGAIKGGRLLGFGSPSTGPNGSRIDGTLTALTTTAQPLLVPVLQLHSPEGIPSTDLAQVFNSSNSAPNAPEARKWLQKAANTDYNAVLVMGDTPIRPYPDGGGENNGGLHNFPRFIENWTGFTATIKGSLIQYTKSKYATGPFDTVDLVTQDEQDNSLFFDSDPDGTPPIYNQYSSPNVNPDPLGYQYKEAAARFKAPFYQPPTRAWGYDVGLLKQTPDLFSRRIALPEAGTPNEFFREVSRDDPWVQRLLCAAEETAPNDYQWALVDRTQRPSLCQAGTPGPEFND